MWGAKGPVVWAANQMLNGSWGYDRDITLFKSPDLLIRMLIDGVVTLEAIGRWMRLHDRSIYRAGPSVYPARAGTRYTHCGDRDYLHLFAWPFEYVHLLGLGDAIDYAQLLYDALVGTVPAITRDRRAVGSVPGRAPGTLTLKLPVRRPVVVVPVVELFLRHAT